MTFTKKLYLLYICSGLRLNETGTGPVEESRPEVLLGQNFTIDGVEGSTAGAEESATTGAR